MILEFSQLGFIGESLRCERSVEGGVEDSGRRPVSCCLAVRLRGSNVSALNADQYHSAEAQVLLAGGSCWSEELWLLPCSRLAQC